jgi:hypothetical protein
MGENSSSGVRLHVRHVPRARRGPARAPFELRFPKLAPADWRRVFAHLLVSALIIQFPMLNGMQLLLANDGGSWFALAAVGIALPAIAYLFLSSIWVLRLAQRLLPGVR